MMRNDAAQIRTWATCHWTTTTVPHRAHTLLLSSLVFLSPSREHLITTKWDAIMVSQLDFGSCGQGSIPSTIIYRCSSAFSKLKSLRSAYWQRLSLLPTVVNSARYPQRKASEQWRTSGSAADLTQRNRKSFANIQVCSFPIHHIVSEKTYDYYYI